LFTVIFSETYLFKFFYWLRIFSSFFTGYATTVQEATTRIDLRQCVTEKAIPVALGSSTEANTLELATTWKTSVSDKNISATRFVFA